MTAGVSARRQRRGDARVPMNTFERHRLYRLRRHRAKIMRRRVFAIAGVAVATLTLWSVMARWGPAPIAPPAPAELGAEAARAFVVEAAHSVNRLDRRLRGGDREQAKSVARALFRVERPVPHAGRAARDAGETSSASVSPVALRQAAVRADTLAQAGHALRDSFSILHAVDTGMFLTAITPEEEDARGGARVLDILLIGLDSRLGEAHGRADALHLLTIDLDRPHIRITSIPRGTWSDLGRKNKGSNILANVRATRGRAELLRRVARLCRRDSVPYYVEVGFSDAFGILELLGYEDPSAELQALRHRRGYRYGDHSRCYNQGQFVRSAILRMLPLLDGVTGDLLLHAGRDLVRTNLTMEQCRGMVYLLNDAGLAARPAGITVQLRSRFRRQVEGESLPVSYAHAVRGIDYGDMGGASDAAERRIRAALRRAADHSARPQRVRSALWTLFQQHAWLQLPNRETRRQLRDSLALLLIDACDRLGAPAEVAGIRRTLQADDVLFFSSGSATTPSSARLLEGP